MKQSMILLFLLLTCFLRSQDVHLYLIPEHIETVSESSLFIASDYVNISETREKVVTSDNYTNEVSPPQWGMVGAEIETVITPKSMYLRLPISYSFKDFKVNLSIPYIFRREMNYKTVKKTANGFGDTVAKLSYHYKKKKFSNELQLKLKLPTGDENKMSDGYLVPLGSGSTDIILANQFSLTGKKYLFQTLISYRKNGTVDRVVEIYNGVDDIVERLKYEIDLGDTFIFNSSLSYALIGKLSLVGGISTVINQEGKLKIDRKDKTIEESSANQDFVFFDISPGLCYSALNTDLLLSLQVPIVTKRNEENNEEKRSPSFLFRLSRDIF